MPQETVSLTHMLTKTTTPAQRYRQTKAFDLDGLPALAASTLLMSSCTCASRSRSFSLASAREAFSC